MSMPTVDEALAFVRRLPLRERAQLIALIAQDIVALPDLSGTSDDPWAALFTTRSYAVEMIYRIWKPCVLSGQNRDLRLCKAVTDFQLRKS